MKKIIQRLIALLMILLAIIPFLVIYDPLSQAIPALPNYEAPGWSVPAGFISIALIVVLSFFLASLSSQEDSKKD